MSTKKRIAIIVSVIVVLIAAAVAALIIRLHSPGVHIFGPFGNIDVTTECFYFEENGQRGTATVSISGSVNPHKGSFSGTINVDRDDELAAKLSKNPDVGSKVSNFVELEDNSVYSAGYPDEYMILYYGTLFDYVDNKLVADINYEYKVFLDDDGKFVLVATKFDDNGNQVYRFTAVNAADEKEAADWYEQAK